MSKGFGEIGTGCETIILSQFRNQDLGLGKLKKFLNQRKCLQNKLNNRNFITWLLGLSF